jgi:type IV pilus assembly protein PilW
MKQVKVSFRTSSRGVSLIELMVSITIGLAILAAILAVYSSTTSTSRKSESTTRMSEDAAIALNYIGNYIRMAGFSFPVANVPVNTAIVGGGTSELIDRNFAGAGVRGCDAGFSNPTVANSADLVCNTGSGSSSIVVRFQGDIRNTNPVNVTTSPAYAGDPADCLNQGVTGTVASDFEGAAAYTQIEARFLVRTGTNSGTPELFCAGNGNAFASAQPIMQYVETMRLTYGVADDVSSLQVTQYLSASAIDSLPGTIDQRWSRVVSVKICLVMRSEAVDANGPSTYTDCAGSTVAAASNFTRRAFQSVIALRNRSGLSS